MTLRGDAKCKGKLTRELKNDIKNLVTLVIWANFVQSI